ncbi:hypothetical protein [Glycomyces sp. MUSA5-2]|uniref:hypothetical protein n=1 Tax=Glycomyces sp. MUSA5-2 TaxID=2053002 RepID=UPI0030085E80
MAETRGPLGHRRPAAIPPPFAASPARPGRFHGARTRRRTPRARAAAALLAASLGAGCVIGPGPDRPTPVPDRTVDPGTPLEAADLCGLLGAGETTALAHAYGYDPGRAEQYRLGTCVQTLIRFQAEMMKESIVVRASGDTWHSPESAAAAFAAWTDPDAITYGLQPFPDMTEIAAIGGDWDAAVLASDPEPADGANFKALAWAGAVIVSVRITVAIPGTDPCPAPGAGGCPIGADTVRDWITTVLLPAVHEHLDEAGLLTG